MNALASTQSQDRYRLPVQAVLNQHVDEACHRLRRRHASAFSRHVTFEQRLREDERLFAHLQGLSIAGADANRTATERCQGASPVNKFVRVWTSFAARGFSRDSLSETLQRCAGNVTELATVCESLRWWPASSPSCSATLALLTATKDDLTARTLLELCGRQRWSVPDEMLQSALSSDEPATRTAAYVYCASFGRHDCIAQVLQGISSTGAANESSLAAACTAMRLGGKQSGMRTLWPAAVSRVGPYEDAEAWRQEALVDLCAALPLAQSREIWAEAQSAGAPTSRLLAAAEAANDPFRLPWLIEQLGDPSVVDEALSALTWLLGEWEATVEETAGRATPQSCWAYIEARQWPSMDVRWLKGEPLDKDGVFDTLLHGPLRFRHHAARHLAMIRPDTPNLDTNAPAAKQLQWLYEAESALEGAKHA